MNSKRLIIDVREPAEYNSGHVKGAINLPPAQILSGSSVLENLDKDTELILYCRTGNRANAAIQVLKGRGFTHLINGINEGHVVKNYL